MFDKILDNPYHVPFHQYQPFLVITHLDRELMTASSLIVHVSSIVILSDECCTVMFIVSFMYFTNWI